MFVNNHYAQPSTIFTYINIDSQAKTDEIVGAKVFYHLIEGLYKEDTNSLPVLKLTKKNLLQIIAMNKNKTSMVKSIQNILQLCDEDDEISVVGTNTDLENDLSNIAKNVTTNGLKRGNKVVIQHIWNLFKP